MPEPSLSCKYTYINDLHVITDISKANQNLKWFIKPKQENVLQLYNNSTPIKTQRSHYIQAS